MGKRFVTNFSRAGFPSYEQIEEEGQAKPCVYGTAWVNTETLATSRRRAGKRTGPKGEPVAGNEYGPRELR
jgi:hypothetical protein